MTRRRAGHWLLLACLTLGALAFALPFYVAVVTAFKPLAELTGGTLLALPRHWTAEPLQRAWSSACIGASCDGLRGSLGNSLAMAVPAACLSVLLGAVNGYALSLWRIRGAHLLFGLILAANVLPYQAVLLPVALLLRHLHLFGSVAGLILVHVAYGMPYVTLLFRNAYRGLPMQVIHAARLDGAGFWSIFVRIVLPLSLPMLTVGLLLQFSAIWNDYLFALVFGGTATPVTVPLDNLINGGRGAPEADVNMAGVLLAAAPPLLLYLAGGRLLLRGLALRLP